MGTPAALIGSSVFTDDDFLSLSFPAKAGFLLLQPWAATTEGGRFGKAAALVHLRSMGAADSSNIWDELVSSDMVRQEDRRWVLAGWDKYQAELAPEPRVADRPTTREGREFARRVRRLPNDWGNEWAIEDGVGGVADPSGHVPDTGLPPKWQGSDGDVPGLWQGGSATPPPPSVAPRPSPPGPPTPHTPPLTPTTRSRSLPAGALASDGTPGVDDDWDIRDTLYQLTTVAPWGKEWGDEALKLQEFYGFAALDQAVRVAFAAMGYTRKPWHLLKQADATLARSAALAREKAARDKIYVPPVVPQIDPDEFDAKTKEYKDAG